MEESVRHHVGLSDVSSDSEDDESAFVAKQLNTVVLNKPTNPLSQGGRGGEVEKATMTVTDVGRQSDEGTVTSRTVPSLDEALASVSKLSFAAYATSGGTSLDGEPGRDVAKRHYKAKAQQQQGSRSAVETMRTFGIPEPSWHVPLTLTEFTRHQQQAKEAEERGKRKRAARSKLLGAAVQQKGTTEEKTPQQEDGDDETSSPTHGEAGSKKQQFASIKQREREKRKRGQSSQQTWKPEEWMKLKQGYD